MKLPDSDIQWAGECDECVNAFMEGLCNGGHSITCPKCNGTGTITRDATLEEVVEGCRQMIECLLSIDIVKGIDLLNIDLAAKEALTINGGILKIKS